MSALPGTPITKPDDPVGSVYVQIECEGRWAITLLTEGWSDAEKAALLAGDDAAKEALITAAYERSMASNHGGEVTHSTISMRRNREASADASH